MIIQMSSNNYMELFIQDDITRPIVLIAPGGGYQRTSPREANPIKDKLVQEGYHVGIIYYRQSILVKEDVLNELVSFYQYILESTHPIDKKKIILMGFSSGGHYIAKLGLTYQHYQLQAPYAMILCYPVITGEEHIAHEDSIKRLYGEINEKTRALFSLEKRVTKYAPPTFLFHTLNDTAVPVENSLKLFNALKKNEILTDLHIFNQGVHGISLGTKEVKKDEDDPNRFELENLHNQNWFNLAMSFLRQLPFNIHNNK